jgi:hypothetical protein
MITNKDLESFDYYEMFPETEKSRQPNEGLL